MARILLMIERAEDRRVFHEILSTQHTVIEATSETALEEPFAKKYPPTDEGPRVAVEGVETDAGRRIVLFTTEPLSLREANATLMAEGFRGVMRLDDVKKLDKLPVLGTGKTDYKVLRGMIGKA